MTPRPSAIGWNRLLPPAGVVADVKSDEGTEAAKRRAAESAVGAVTDGMTVGLGTGSTAAYAIRELGRRVDAGLDIQGVPTSFQARQLAREVGIPLRALEDIDRLDVAIDGADQVAGLDLVKGGGAAHAREKVIDAAADAFHVVVDKSKLGHRLDRPVPIAVLPVARTTVAARLAGLGGDPSLRVAAGKDGPVVTDDGNLVIDCGFGPIDDPSALSRDLDSVPGIVAHGLFVGLADAVHVGTESAVEVREKG